MQTESTPKTYWHHFHEKKLVFYHCRYSLHNSEYEYIPYRILIEQTGVGLKLALWLLIC